MKTRALFIHNSTSEYRMEFWKQLKNTIDCDFLITNRDLSDKIYKFENNKNLLEFLYWDSYSWKDLKKLITGYNVVILPPQDSFKEEYISHKVLHLCKKFKIKTIYWSERWDADKNYLSLKKKIKNAIQMKVIASIACKCDLCIAAGTKAKEYLEKIGVEQRKIGVAIDSSTSPISDYVDIRKKYSIDDSKKIILFLGRLISRKGCLLLIESIKDELDSLNAVLLICGDGEDLQRCKNLSENNKNVIFAGMVQPDERKNYYEQSNLFVIPSICENGIIEAWGLTVNEALECGTPVLASDSVGAAWDLINKGNGIMYNDSKEISKNVKYLLNCRFNRETIKKDYEKFNVEAMATRFSYLIISLKDI